MVAPPVSAKDSMKSTWRLDRSVWWLPHYAINLVDPRGVDKDAPVFSKTDKVPVADEWSPHLWILTHALWPILLQQLYNTLTGRTLGPLAVFLLYLYAMRINAISEASLVRKLGRKFGYFDGDKAPRDGVPDTGVVKTFLSIQWTTAIRPFMAIALASNTSAVPALSCWLGIEIGLYSLVLDFWFYTYHRACHEIASLWKYHRTHHLVKHPNMLLSAYADWQQEIIEIALVPIATYLTLKFLGLPMGFHDWWICHEYIIFTEAFGHSGVRLYVAAPSTISPILHWLDCELVIEDHDLHHRIGWKKSHNYGKQTRFWDRLFGTCIDRIECSAANLDYSVKPSLSLF